MTKVDQFESMFRAAQREALRYERPEFDSILVVTDLDAGEAGAFTDAVRSHLSVLTDSSPTWRVVSGPEFQTAADLLDLVSAAKPSLICTYRCLHSTSWKWPYSLGTHLDVLTQHTRTPVLVLPHPKADRAAGHAVQRTRTVMAITDHLAGEHRLVNHALRFVDPDGTLWLTHVEDEATFERYMETIAKIPAIDTSQAREEIRAQLLKDPHEYVARCREMIEEQGLPVTIEEVVTFGGHLPEYRKLIETHQVDLLVLHTKDEDQLAMRGVAYELAVELRSISLLML